MSDTTVITLAHRASRSDQVLFQDVGGEAVLLDLASERYFGLDEVGTRIWELLDAAPTLEEVHRTLCAEFNAEPARIEQDMLVLVDELVGAGLIIVH